MRLTEQAFLHTTVFDAKLFKHSAIYELHFPDGERDFFTKLIRRHEHAISFTLSDISNLIQKKIFPSMHKLLQSS